MDTISWPSTAALLGHLYDAVMAPSGFQTFIEALTGHFRLKAVTMIIREPASQEVKALWVHGITTEWLEKYSLEYARSDMLAQHIMISPIANFYASNLDVPHAERFPETRFYNEWLVPQGVAYAAGAVVLQEGAWLTQLFLQRSPAQPPFAREDLDRLNELVPHLQRAIQMRQRFAELQFGQNFLAGGLDVLAMPTLLFNEYSQVVHKNRSAEVLLAQATVLRIDGGHLQTADLALTKHLNLEIGNAIRASRGENEGSHFRNSVLVPRKGRMPLTLMIAPLRLAASPTVQGAALVFAFDPEIAPSVTVDLVRCLFGLSEGEAELSVSLCCGLTLDGIASERGTSINTVKSQLKNVFLKTGTKRQSELVSMLLTSPAYFLAQKPANDLDPGA